MGIVRLKQLYNKKWILPFFIVVSILGAVFVSYGLYGYFPGSDEAHQIQAAHQLVAGNGLSMPGVVTTKDGISFVYTYVTQWPPGYSGLISLGLLLGLSVNVVGPIIKFLLFLACIIVWYRLAMEYISNEYLRMVWVAGISSLLLLSFKLSTDIILWALFGWFSYYMLFVYPYKKNTWLGSTHRLVHLLIWSGMIALGITMKYLAIVCVVIGGIWIMLQGNMRVRERVLHSAILGALPMGTYGVLTYINGVMSGAGTGISLHTFSYAIDPYWLFRSFIEFVRSFFFLGPSDMQQLVGYIAKLVSLEQRINVLEYLIPGVIVAIGVYVAYRYRTQLFQKEETRQLVRWFLVSALGTYLIYIPAAYKSNLYEIYWPFIRSRYHVGLILLVILIVLIWAQEIVQKKWIRNFSTIAIVGIIAVAQVVAYVHIIPTMRIFHTEKIQVIDTIYNNIGLSTLQPPVIIALDDIQKMLQYDTQLFTLTVPDVDDFATYITAAEKTNAALVVVYSSDKTQGVYIDSVVRASSVFSAFDIYRLESVPSIFMLTHYTE